MGVHLAVPSTLEHYFYVHKAHWRRICKQGIILHLDAFGCIWTHLDACRRIWTIAILVVGLPVGRFPDCTPLLFWQVAAHVDVSGKVGWEGFDSEGWQGGPHSYLSSGLVTSNLCQPKLGGRSCFTMVW